MGRLRKGNEGEGDEEGKGRLICEGDGEGKGRLICEGEERTEGWYCRWMWTFRFGSVGDSR